ncbi:hypothetical protein CsSME_00007890 [Camellia sinensis var. sinensis]|uniref:Uncharacterized protein n=1 Tax=Camellia sinensis var. sinensis TaxID=542762 RepID=A0A4S4DHN7_CAMSN|nr:uncharacterized protein LOC114309920 [Camellia sinensis]THG02318.1 hypothetical protein TEA_021160 [Camellia sinensis var. sinensis]
MRPSLLVSLLLFSILISDVQAIRLNKGFLPVGHDQIHVGVEVAIHCKDENCSGNIRKLVSKANSNPTTTNTATTISKNDKNGGTKAGSISTGKLNTNGLSEKEESFSVKSSPVSEHREASPEHYPDILDIAGMDYSPAKRKPPIHN